MDIFKSATTICLGELPSMSGDKHLLGRLFQAQGGATPPNRILHPE